jgi:hypothetical protein
MPTVKLSVLDVFVGLCESCQVCWLVGAFLDPHHALIAVKLIWLCPTCLRPQRLQSGPYQGLPETKPC